jgi:hypothetical protein
MVIVIIISDCCGLAPGAPRICVVFPYVKILRGYAMVILDIAVVLGSGIEE